MVFLSRCLSSCRLVVLLSSSPASLCPCLLRHPVLVVLSSPICSFTLLLCVIACPLVPPPSSLVSSASILFSFACLRVVIAPRPLRPFLPYVLVSSSYRLSPRSFDEPGGALFACLSLSRGSSSSRRLRCPFVFSCPCLPRGSLPFASCGRLSRPPLSSFSSLVCVRSSPLVASSPRSSTSVGGAGVGSLLFACLIILACGPPCRAGGGSVSADGGRHRAAAWLLACLGMAAGDVVSAAGCVRFVVSLFVYINWVPARVS